MNGPTKLPRTFLKGLSLATLTLGVGGCVVEARHDRAVYRDPPPREVVVERDRPVERDRDVVVNADVAYEPAPVEVVATYEPDLNPYGSWVEVEGYGRCWTPRERPSGWRPYSVGRWVSTDDGWCWQAEEQEARWGLVTYHYGRWYEHPRHGWVWVPGTTWGPAWVSWREGGGYCGWAPLPPQCGYGPGVSVAVIDRYTPADRYSYVDVRYMGEPRIREHFIRERDNVTIINRTTNITNITVVNNRVINRGVSVERVEQVSGRRVERVQVTEVHDAAEAHRLRDQGRPVAYVPAAAARADVAYRQRVERRTADVQAQNQAERQRVDRRATDAQVQNQAERQRVERRATDATADKQAERERVAAREKAAADAERARVERHNTDATTDRQAERERVAARDKAAADAERARVERRSTDVTTDKQAEHDRAVRRAQEADAARRGTPAAEPRSARTPTPAPAPTRSDPKAAPAQPKTDKELEHERAVRRAQDAARTGERPRGEPDPAAPPAPVK